MTFHCHLCDSSGRHFLQSNRVVVVVLVTLRLALIVAVVLTAATVFLVGASPRLVHLVVVVHRAALVFLAGASLMVGLLVGVVFLAAALFILRLAQEERWLHVGELLIGVVNLGRLAGFVEDHVEDSLVALVDVDTDLVLHSGDGQALLDAVFPGRQHDVSVTLILPLRAVELVGHFGPEALPFAAVGRVAFCIDHLVELHARLLWRYPSPEVFKHLPVEDFQLLPHVLLLDGLACLRN